MDFGDNFNTNRMKINRNPPHNMQATNQVQVFLYSYMQQFAITHRYVHKGRTMHEHIRYLLEHEHSFHAGLLVRIIEIQLALIQT